MYDYYMAPGVLKTFKKIFYKNLYYILEDEKIIIDKVILEGAINKINSIKFNLYDFVKELDTHNFRYLTSEIAEKAYNRSIEETDKETYQAMEGFIHNLNTMNSRAGA